MIEKFINYINDKNKAYVIFDIGSRDCQQSIEFYKTFPNAKIYSFECNPNTLHLCEENIIPYQDRITLIKGAVCDYDGNITFYPINQEKTKTTWKDGNPGASSLFKSNGKYTVETYVQDEITTNCHRLDTIMNKHNIPCVDIIWMDLQGAELLALKGLGNKLSSVEYLYTEVSHKEMYTGQVMYKELNDYMIKNNFSILNKLRLSGWQEDVVYKKKKISDTKGITLNEPNNKYDLTFFKYNKYSQRGHDGIIEKIMKELDIKKGFFIEFGGWDGIYLSNCRNLFKKGWSGCFIEANKNKYLELVENYKNSNVICLNNFVYPISLEGATVDSLYKQHMNDVEVDLLSIDIDGRDYEIFENLSLRPKLIIIEGGFLFHPCLRCKIPYEIAKNNVQQPLYVLFKLAKKKNYVPICFNQDTFLLRKDLYEANTFFQEINNDCVSLWSSAFFNIFSEKDRLLLQNYRKQNDVVKRYEHKYYIDIEHSLYNVFDIVIPVGPNDKSVIEQQIKYTQKNIIGYRNIYLICYDPSITIEGCITINENIFPFNIDTVAEHHGKLERNGWYLQQLLKLYAGKIISNILDKYLVIDADTFFLKPTTFVENNKCLYNYGTEYHKPYFHHMEKLDKDLTKIDKSKSGICHHMIFDKKYIDELISKIEKNHNELFYNIFLKTVTNKSGSGASEYEIYFNYMLKYNPDKIQIRKLSWSNTNKLVSNSNYDYISYHWYMR